MRRKNFFSKIFNINSVSIIIITSILLFGTFYNYSDFLESHGLSRNYLIALSFICFLTLYSSIFYELHKLKNKISIFKDNEIIELDNLSDAIKKAIGSRRKIQKLRVFALTTNLIQPFIRDALIGADCEIKQCYLLIRDLTDDYKIFREETQNIIQRWKEDIHIKNIEIAHFPDILSDYCILIDDEIAILGTYIFTDKDISHVTINNVILVHDSRTIGKNIIANYIRRFDNSFEYFVKNKGKHPDIKNKQEIYTER